MKLEAGGAINFGTIMQGLILAAVLWVGKSVHELQVQQAAVAVQLAEVAEIKADVRELQGVAAANRQQIAINSRRLDMLERAK